MGPCYDGIASSYGNDIKDVAELLNEKHENRYMVYNLCHQRIYDAHFDGNVCRFPLDQHIFPSFDNMQKLINAIDEWFVSDHLNIAAIHHNENRRGIVAMIIICYLLHAGDYKSAESAIKYFRNTIRPKKTDNDYDEDEDEWTNASSQPSYNRWCQYYEKLCLLKNTEKSFPKPRRYQIDKIFISKNCPKFKIVRIKCPETAEYELNGKRNEADAKCIIKTSDGWWVYLSENEREYVVCSEFSIEFLSGGFRYTRLWSCQLNIDWELCRENALNYLISGFIRQDNMLDESLFPMELIMMISSWYKETKFTHIDRVNLMKQDLDKVCIDKKQKNFEMTVYWSEIDE